MDLDSLQLSVLAICAHDDVGLWRFISRASPAARDAFPVPTEALTTALQAIENLVDRGLIEAGNPNGSTFRAIPGSTEDLAAFIEKELEELGRSPGPGDVCWFRATAAGKNLAKELDLKGY